METITHPELKPVRQATTGVESGKITLKNLANASAQQVFDQVAKHLLKQSKKSQKSMSSFAPDCVGCAYRGDEGTKCAAGSLIADSEYNPGWENSVWFDLVRDGYVPDKHMELICRLQKIHDKKPVEQWRFALYEEALFQGLNTDILGI